MGSLSQPESCHCIIRCQCSHALGCCAGAVRALERVADKALQLGEAALCGYRSHSSSQCKNAALLHYAVSALPCAPVNACDAIAIGDAAC